MPRLFVGVPAPGKLALAELRRRLSDDGNVKLVDPDLYHVTLAFLGDTPEGQVEDAVKAIEEGVGEAEAREGRVRGLGAFPRPGRARVLWAGVHDADLEPVAKGVRSELSSRDIDFDDRHDFHAHLTVARLRDHADIGELVTEHEQTDFGAFPLESVDLYESTLTPEGPVYEVRASHELG